MDVDGEKQEATDEAVQEVQLHALSPQLVAMPIR